MMNLTLFTKSWKLPLPELGRLVKRLGFDGVELPVRPGYQVAPENVARDLPEAVRILADCGLKIGTLAGPTDELTIAACGACGIPIIRVCIGIPVEKDYLTAIRDLQGEWDRLVPVLAKHGVALGVQNHCDRFIANAMQLRHAIGRYDPRHICAVWDPAHNALEGEQMDVALDTVWSHLRVVNLKNAFWRRTNGPEAPCAAWEVYWTTGRQGRAHWPTVIAELKKRGFRGDLCFSAEYSDGASVDRLIADDIAFAKTLLNNPA